MWAGGVWVCVGALLAAAGAAAAAERQYAFINDSSFTVHLTASVLNIPPFHLVRAIYENAINETGWAFLEIHSDSGCPDEQQARAAGFLEGYLTRDLIWMHWLNLLKGYCAGKEDVCALIDDYIDKNLLYINSMFKNGTREPYWYQVKLYYEQLAGLGAGYRAATADPMQALADRDIIWMNMLGDLDELAFALSMPRAGRGGQLLGEEPAAWAVAGQGDHCSGLVKLLPDGSDLYTSQTTWNSYQSMLRVQKLYTLGLHVVPGDKQLIPGHKMSMSSYPGLLHSLDDFYIMSSGLVPAETTTGNSNRTLFLRVRPRGQLLEFVRAMVANRLATTGREWVALFRRHNSGTYNNQWYVVDYKQFRPGSGGAGGTPPELRPGLLWVLEQLPGYVESADLTQKLATDKYFPSYNIQYFPRAFNLSGGWERVAAFGEWFAYDRNPRALIFKRDHVAVRNLKDMFVLMRSNDYKHDPLSRCAACVPPYSACNAVAARNDLNPPDGKYPFRALGHRSHGATDTKITGYRLARGLHFLSVSSPPANISRGVPPFRWTETDLNVSHYGHPDLWMFKPLVHKWQWG